jgi:hypothetical protein
MFESKGLWRTIGATISALGGIAAVVPVPVVQAWAPVLLTVGATIGGLGVVRAAAVGKLKIK